MGGGGRGGEEEGRWRERNLEDNSVGGDSV